MSYGSDGDGPMVTFMSILFIAVLVIGMRVCASSDCSAICKANGDKADYTWTQGCYCKSAEDGTYYNPKDARDR